MVDFSQLLKKRVDDIKPPATLPEGTYRGIITKFEFGASQQKQTPFVKFTIKFLAAEDDVDPEGLKEIDFSKVERNHSFYLTESSEFMLAAFIKSCGVNTVGRSLGETIPEVQNANVLVKVAHRLDPNNPERTFVDIKELSGVQD